MRMRVSGRAAIWAVVAAVGAVGTLCAQTQSTPQRRPGAATVNRTQTSGSSGTIAGTVTDTTGAIVPNATVMLSNAVSGFTRTVTTDSAGGYAFGNVPFNTYKLTTTAASLAPATQTVDVQSYVLVSANVTLGVAAATETVNVTAKGGDLVETDPVNHTDVDRGLFEKIPLESATSSVTAVVTQTSPGVSSTQQ